MAKERTKEWIIKLIDKDIKITKDSFDVLDKAIKEDRCSRFEYPFMSKENAEKRYEYEKDQLNKKKENKDIFIKHFN